MNIMLKLKDLILDQAETLFNVSTDQLPHLEFKINADQASQFGDVSCNIALLLSKHVGKNPREIAAQLHQALVAEAHKEFILGVVIAGPGFLNITVAPHVWRDLVYNLYKHRANFFKLHHDEQRYRCNIEFVSANPTGPLHLGHGRGAIIGDTLARVLNFLGHAAHKEFYINDAGNQIVLLGKSLKVRCLQQLGQAVEVPEGGYAGDYLVDLARDCVAVHGTEIMAKSDQFFELYAKEQLLSRIRADLQVYGITFDTWFSEKTLHDSGAIDRALVVLQSKSLVYEQDDALWFKSTQFGDDKDRVVRKSSGELTYIAADLAYLRDKFDREFEKVFYILGHDHHSYKARLRAAMQAFDYDVANLEVILYQLVNIVMAGEAVKMSKRAGTFTTLSDVVEAVGADVARFFYLNRKIDAPLDFDLDVALKKTDENPVYYIQYAYVRMSSLLQKAGQEGFADWVESMHSGSLNIADVDGVVGLMGPEELLLIKKIVSMGDILRSIAHAHQTHLLSYFALELAQKLHAYYTKHKVIDLAQRETSQMRMFTVFIVHQALGLTLDLLGLSKPEKM